MEDVWYFHEYGFVLLAKKKRIGAAKKLHPCNGMARTERAALAHGRP
jgi:hypothetical protein